MRRKPAIAEALLANLAALNGLGGGFPTTPEAANLRFLLESVNLAVTRSILEDNLARLNGGVVGGFTPAAAAWPPLMPERLTGLRHNSYDSDAGTSDEDCGSTLYLEPDIEMQEEEEEELEKVKTLPSAAGGGSGRGRRSPRPRRGRR